MVYDVRISRVTDQIGFEFIFIFIFCVQGASLDLFAIFCP